MHNFERLKGGGCSIPMKNLVFRGIVLFTLFNTLMVAAQTAGVYKGELQLPVDLYTSEGILLEKGTFEIEVRQEKGHYALVAIKKDKVLARLRGEMVSEDESLQVSRGMPLTGTLRLEEASEGAKETANESAANPSPYLSRLSWRVTLRVFEAPNKNDVVFVFRNNRSAEPSTTVTFRLFRNKPK
jgi:hypothetical protein